MIRCECCGEEKTLAEALLDLAAYFRAVRPDGGIVEVTREPKGGYEAALSRLVMANKFSQLPKSVIFRAIAEDWDHRRIFLEVYV